MKQSLRSINLKKQLTFPLMALFLLLSVSSLIAQTYVEHADIVDKTDTGIGTTKSFITTNGHVYILSASNDASITTTDGSTHGGNYDVLFTHYDENGNVITKAFVGGAGNEFSSAIYVDNNGTVIIVSQTSSANFPVMGGGSHAAHGLAEQFTRTIFNSSGQMVFSDYVTEDNQQALGVAPMITDDGNGTFFMVWGSPQTLGLGTSNIAIIRFDINGPALSSVLLPSIDSYIDPLKIEAENGLVFLSSVEGIPSPFTYNYRKFDYQLNQLFMAETGLGSMVLEGNYIHQAGVTNVDLGIPSTDGTTFVSGAKNLVVSKRNISDNSIVYLSYVGATSFFFNLEPLIVIDAGDIYIIGTDNPGGIASTDGSVSTGTSLFFMKKNAAGVTQYISYYGGSGAESIVTSSIDGDFLWIGGVTQSATDFPTTDGSFVPSSGDPNHIMIKVDKNTGEVMLANTFGSIDDYAYNSRKVPGGFVYVGLQVDNVAGIIPVTNPTGPLGGPYYAKFSICPTNFTFSPTVTPVIQNVCQNGLVTQIEADRTFIDGATFPTLYTHGVPSIQPDVEAEYQWQEATAAGGPWVDIPSAISKNYTPDPTVTDKFYRRIDKEEASCGGAIINTTDVSSIIVNGFVAPIADAGGIFNSCPGLMENIGATPLATGGTPPYTYEWFEGDAAVAFSVLENPLVATGATAGSFVYTAIVTDANSCVHIDQSVLNVHEADAGVDVGFCQGTAGVRIGGSPIPGVAGVVYAWAPALGLSCTDCAQPIANPAVATTYTLTLTIPRPGGGTCTSMDNVLVTPVLAPTVGGGEFAGPDQVMCLGDVVTIGFAPEAGFGYTWASGDYLVDNMVSEATVMTGNLAMPTPNPLIYYVTAEKDGCLFVDDVEVAAIEARADVDGCGPRTVGLIDRTPNITETYTWSIVSGGGTFQGVSNEDIVAVTASPPGSPTTYHLDVSYNGHTCMDEVVVPDCGCVVEITVEAPFVCPAFTLNGGDVKLIATAAAINFPDPDYFTYTWSPAAGLSSTTGREVTLTDNVQRTYTVTMSDPNGSAFSCFETIEVNHPAWSLPVFNSPDVSTCQGMPIQIGDAFVAGYSYDWRGDLGLSNYTLSDPMATVNSTTTFEVTVTDIGSGCITIEETLVDVGDAAANAGPDHLVCDNGVITLGVPAVAGVTYAWTPIGANWQNGTDENSANPDVLVAINTTFDLTVTDIATGCMSTDQVVVTVGTGPPPFAMAGISFCPSTSGPLTLGAGAPVAGIVSYSWSPAFFLDDPTIINPMTTSLPNTEIVFTLVVTNADGCEQISTQTITPTITPPIVGGAKALCIGDITMLGDAANPTGGGISYLWTPATDLSDPTSPNPIYTATTAGLTTYSLTKTEAGCDVVLTVDVNVKEYVLPDMTPETVCDGACVSIGVPDDASATFTWTPAAGLATTDVATTIACPAATTLYTLTAQGANGCITEKDVLVSITLPAAPALTIADPGVQCLGTTGVSFSSAVVPAGAYDYTWSPNDGTLSDIYSDAPGVTFTTAGTTTYSLTVTDPATGCSTIENVALQTIVCAPPMPCSVMITTVVPTACAGANLYDLAVTITYNDGGLGGDIIITTDNGASQTFTPAAAMGTETFTLTGLAADEVMDIDVTAAYVADGTCTNTLTDAYSAPAICVCPPARCGEVSVLKN